MVSNSPGNGPEFAQIVTVYVRHVNAPGVYRSWKSLRVPKTGSNSARNGPESAKTASVDDDT